MKEIISKEIYNQIEKAKKIASLQPDQSFKISQDAYNLAKINNLELEQGYALMGMSLASEVKTDIANMLDCGYKALGIFQDKNSVIGKVKALNTIGMAYLYSSMYENALKCFLDGKDLLIFEKDDLFLTRILNNIGKVYKESQMYDKAMEYYNKATEIAIKNNDYFNQAIVLANIGEIYFSKREFHKALDVLKKSYIILAKENDMVCQGDVGNKIGRIYFTMGDFSKAKKYYFSALRKLEAIDNKYYAVDVLINMAQLHQKNLWPETLHFYKKAEELAQNVGSQQKLCKIYCLIAEYCEKQKDYKNAIIYCKKHSALSEEIMSLSLKNKLEVLTIELKNIELTKRSEQITIRLEQEIVRQKNELENIKISNKILEQKVHQDELTGIKNRRSLNTYLNRLLNQKSLKELIVLFMVDIDKFKNYNDCWGHVKGDECLKKIAASIQEIQSTRGDAFGRYGGEEFIYISKINTYKEAINLGNLLRTQVEKLGFYYTDEEKEKKTTISVGGVMGYVNDFESKVQIIELADQELYKVKKMGGNKTLLKKWPYL